MILQNHKNIDYSKPHNQTGLNKLKDKYYLNFGNLEGERNFVEEMNELFNSEKKTLKLKNKLIEEFGNRIHLIDVEEPEMKIFHYYTHDFVRFEDYVKEDEEEFTDDMMNNIVKELKEEYEGKELYIHSNIRFLFELDKGGSGKSISSDGFPTIHLYAFLFITSKD